MPRPRIVSTTVLVVLVLVLAAVFGRRWWSEPRTDAQSAAPVAVEIAGRTLALPANVLRFSEQRRPGVKTRLDLALVAPDWIGRTEETASRLDTVEEPSDVVFVTLAASTGEPDTAALLATVYRRLFTGETVDPVGGLDGRRLSAAAGYAGEVVWFEPGQVHPFAARCWPLVPDGPVTTCLHVENRDGLTVAWRFPRAMLEGWRGLRDGLDRRLAAWGVPPRP